MRRILAIAALALLTAPAFGALASEGPGPAPPDPGAALRPTPRRADAVGEASIAVPPGHAVRATVDGRGNVVLDAVPLGPGADHHGDGGNAGCLALTTGTRYARTPLPQVDVFGGCDWELHAPGIDFLYLVTWGTFSGAVDVCDYESWGGWWYCGSYFYIECAATGAAVVAGASNTVVPVGLCWWTGYGKPLLAYSWPWDSFVYNRQPSFIGGTLVMEFS